LQAAYDVTGGTADVCPALRFDFHVVQALSHAHADLTGEHGGLIVSGWQVSSLSAHEPGFGARIENVNTSVYTFHAALIATQT
jgi:hypothetical protein